MTYRQLLKLLDSLTESQLDMYVRLDCRGVEHYDVGLDSLDGEMTLILDKDGCPILKRENWK